MDWLQCIRNLTSKNNNNQKSIVYRSCVHWNYAQNIELTNYLIWEFISVQLLETNSNDMHKNNVTNRVVENNKKDQHCYELSTWISRKHVMQFNTTDAVQMCVRNYLKQRLVPKPIPSNHLYINKTNKQTVTIHVSCRWRFVRCA